MFTHRQATEGLTQVNLDVLAISEPKWYGAAIA